MEEVEAKLNLCTIFYRQISNGEKTSSFGCGCVVKFSEDLIKVATSRKIFTEQLAKVEIIAKFEDQDQEFKLKFAEEEEGFQNGDKEIVYLSFEDTAEGSGQLPGGLFKAENAEVDYDCVVPVLENMERFHAKNEFSFYDVVKDTGKCSLQKKMSDNKRILFTKREVHKNHLEVLGSPILTADEHKFLGIVDFLEVENESLLRMNYHDGIQDGRDGSSHESHEKHKTVIAQETNREAENEGLTTGDKLADLWNISIDFRDDFSKVLNVKYTEMKYWPHLAEKFGIDKSTYEAFSSSDIRSPTETLFDYLATTDPDFNVKELCQSLDVAEACEVSLIAKDSIKAGYLREHDLVTDICDKAPAVLDAITLKLDREDRLWINLARARGIQKKDYSTFQSDRTDNPTRLFFAVLAAEGPDLSIQNFKEKLKKFDMKNLVQVLNKSKISDEMPLRDLSNHPNAKSDIETILNDLKTDALWKLASLYQKEGLMTDINIEQRFRQQEDCNNPTSKVMEYVLSSLPTQYTIKDLIVKLDEIKRKDCLAIIEPYLRGGKDDIVGITEALKRLEGRSSNGRYQPCTWDDMASCSIAASDKSEESDNIFVTNYNTTS